MDTDSLTFLDSYFPDDASSTIDASDNYTGCGARSYTFNLISEAMFTMSTGTLTLAPTLTTEADNSPYTCTLTVGLVDWADATTYDMTFTTCEVTPCTVTSFSKTSLTDGPYVYNIG